MAAKIRGPQIDTGADGIQTANIEDLAVTTAKIDNLGVTTGKIAANAVTSAKVDSTVIIASGANAFTGDQSMGSNKLTNLTAGTASTDAVNKGQLDAVSAGLDPKASCRLATDAALSAYTASGSGVGKQLQADANGALTIDGQAVANGERVLVKDEGAGTDIDNGIYTQTQLGDGSNPWILVRATDFDTDAQVTAGAFTFVTEGTANDNTGWVLATNDPIAIDTTALSFTQFSGAGTIIAGDGLTKTVNTLNVIGGNGITANADDIEVDYETVGNITTVNAGDSASAGVNNTAARGDHEHAVATAVAVSAEPGQSNAEGSSTSLSRADHTHAHSAGSPVGLGSANAAGAATTFNRSDHVHARDTENQEGITTEAISSSDTALADTLNATPINAACFKLFLNGVFQDEGTGRDYTRSGGTITWLASSGTAVNMKTSDTLTATYIS